MTENNSNINTQNNQSGSGLFSDDNNGLDEAEHADPTEANGFILIITLDFLHKNIFLYNTNELQMSELWS